jgi:hypothetical protein
LFCFYNYNKHQTKNEKDIRVFNLNSTMRVLAFVIAVLCVHYASGGDSNPCEVLGQLRYPGLVPVFGVLAKAADVASKGATNLTGDFNGEIKPRQDKFAGMACDILPVHGANFTAFLNKVNSTLSADSKALSLVALTVAAGGTPRLDLRFLTRIDLIKTESTGTLIACLKNALDKGSCGY